MRFWLTCSCLILHRGRRWGAPVQVTHSLQLYSSRALTRSTQSLPAVGGHTITASSWAHLREVPLEKVTVHLGREGGDVGRLAGGSSGKNKKKTCPLITVSTF